MTDTSITPTQTVDPPAVTLEPQFQSNFVQPGYTVTNNTTISFNNYTFTPNPLNFVGKILSSDKNNSFSISDRDLTNAVFKHDSLFLTTAGAKKIVDTKYIDLAVLINNSSDNSKYQKSFKIVLNDFLTNRVLAHRGAYVNLNYPENSMASLKQAIKLGCQASEFDVHITADKVVIVYHDDTLRNIKGPFWVEKLTYAEINDKLKLSNGESVPILKDYIAQIMTQNKTRLQLEIKMSMISNPVMHNNECVDSVISIVHRMGAQAWVHYTSYGYDILKRLVKSDPSAFTIYVDGVTYVYTAAQIKKDGIAGIDYSYDVFKKTPSLVTDAKANGLQVGAWTIDDSVNMTWWLGFSPNTILTNQPELALTIFK